MTTATLDRGSGTTSTVAERPQSWDSSETEDQSEVGSWMHSHDPWGSSAMTGAGQPDGPLGWLDSTQAVPPELVRGNQPSPEGRLYTRHITAANGPHPAVVDHDEGATYDADGDLDWLSQNLDEVTSQYSNMWIAVVNKSVVASAGTLEALMEILSTADIHRPLITEIPPAEEVVWTVAYGSEGI